VWTISTEAADPDEWARAVAQAETQAASPETQRELQSCIDGSQEWGEPGYQPSRGECEDMILPRPEYYIEYNQQRPEEAVEGYAPGIAILTAAVLALAAMTYAGADWASGSMSNQLLFNPRRGQLFTAKALAIGAMAGAVTILAHAAWWLSFAVIAGVRDLAWRAGWTTDVLQLVALSAAFSALVATGSYALTMLLRHTVAALASVLAVLALSLVFIHGLGGDSHVQRVSPALNAAAIFFDDVSYDTYDWSEMSEQRDYQENHLGTLHGFGYWGVIWGAVAGAAFVAFRRRDVP
ncbi:hypothetical protein, partial [Nocardioides sp.]|uniref:hypothetical protein n=1 Tax=Nocardioides sp. TaxID=35761 RepID=UPI002C915AEC